MSNRHQIEYTDTYGGEANCSWVRRCVVTMPELTHYGYDGGTNYVKANKVYNRELMKEAKAAMGLTGVRGVTYHHGDMSEFRPYGMCTVLFITYLEDGVEGETN